MPIRMLVLADAPELQAALSRYLQHFHRGADIAVCSAGELDPDMIEFDIAVAEPILIPSSGPMLSSGLDLYFQSPDRVVLISPTWLHEPPADCPWVVLPLREPASLASAIQHRCFGEANVHGGDRDSLSTLLPPVLGLAAEHRSRRGDVQPNSHRQ